MKKVYLAIFILVMPTMVFAYSKVVLKYSKQGDFLWSKNYLDYNSGGLDSSLIIDGLGHLYLVEGGMLTQYDMFGNAQWHDDFTAFGLKTDSDGNYYYMGFYDDIDFIESRTQDNVKRWQKKYRDYFFHDISLDRNDDVYLFIVKKPDSYYLYNCSIHKYSYSGKLLWKITISEEHGWPLSAHSIHINDNKIIVVGGTSKVEGEDKEDYIFVSILDLGGNELHFNYLDYSDFELLEFDQAGDLIVAWHDVKKYSIDGQLLWQYEFDSLEVMAISVDSENNIIGVGRIVGPSQRDTAIAVFKLNLDGSMLWEKWYERDYINFKRMLVDSEDNVIAVGYEGRTSGSIPIDTSYFALKLDPDGELLWHETYQPFEGYSAFASDAVLDDEDNIYIAGYSYDYTDGDDDDEPGCGCF